MTCMHAYAPIIKFMVTWIHIDALLLSRAYRLLKEKRACM